MHNAVDRVEEVAEFEGEPAHPIGQAVVQDRAEVVVGRFEGRGIFRSGVDAEGLLHFLFGFYGFGQVEVEDYFGEEFVGLGREVGCFERVMGDANGTGRGNEAVRLECEEVIAIVESNGFEYFVFLGKYDFRGIVFEAKGREEVESKADGFDIGVHGIAKSADGPRNTAESRAEGDGGVAKRDRGFRIRVREKDLEVGGEVVVR